MDERYWCSDILMTFIPAERCLIPGRMLCKQTSELVSLDFHTDQTTAKRRHSSLTLVGRDSTETNSNGRPFLGFKEIT